VWPNVANANEDIQTNENHTVSQEYHKNRKAAMVLHMNKADTEQKEPEDKQGEDDEHD
jgi:hypothetical protein